MGRRGFGIDIGGTGIKGAPVDLETGELAEERLRLLTPSPSRPEAVAEVVREVLEHFGWEDGYGCTYPGAVTKGVARSAANVDRSWIGTDAVQVFKDVTGQDVTVLNDADAAGVAEAAFGAAQDVDGLVVLVTLGTGIGTALIYNGVLVPNTELGHIELDGHDAELYAAANSRKREGMSWEKWAKHVGEYLRRLEALLWPELFVIGGGASKKSQKFLPYLETHTRVKAAELHNEAGIVGAAISAVSSR